MKIKTSKYEIYVEGGQVYHRDGRYYKPLTEEQIDILEHEKFKTKTDKSRLDKMIENDFDGYEPEHEISLESAREKLQFKPSEMESLCEHYFRHLETKQNKYIFYCGKCLLIKEKPL